MQLSNRSIAVDAFFSVWGLNVRYADALDQKDFSAWPELFSLSGRYRILSAENVQRGRSLPIIDYTHPGMMRDRMNVLKQAAVFTNAAERRIFSNVALTSLGGDVYSSTANFAIYRTDNIDGTTTLFVTGRYEDEVEIREERALFRSRTAIVDTFSIPNHIGFPL